MTRPMPASSGKCARNRFRPKASPEVKRKALDALCEHEGNKRLAAKAAGVDISTLDDWRRKDSDFTAAWDAVILQVMRKLREQPRGDHNRWKRSPLEHGLKATEENKEIVLAHLAAGATYAAAAAAVGVHRGTMLNWRDTDAAFAERFRDAVDTGLDRLEDEAVRRACDGVLRPVLYKGEIVGHVRQYSDMLLQLLLIGKRPHIYGRRPADIASPQHADGILEVRWKE